MGHKRSISEKKKMKKLHRQCADRYVPGGIYYDKEKKRYVRFWRGRRSKWLKNQCNRKIRRNKKAFYKQHKKETEFWWNYD